MKEGKELLLELYEHHSEMSVHYLKVAKESMDDKDIYWFNMGMASMADMARRKVFELFENNYPEEQKDE